MSILRCWNIGFGMFILSISGMMMGAELWPAPVPGVDGAYHDCPCVRNVHNRSLESLFPHLVVFIENMSFLKAGEDLVPPDWGSGMCASWEAIVDARCKERNPPVYCMSKWCYVNQSSCQRRSSESLHFSDFYLSYEACGYANPWSPALFTSWIHTRPLYAFGFGGRALYRPGGPTIFCNIFLFFAAPVLTTLGIDPKRIRYRESVSKAALTRFKSTYTACVHDVVVGNTDMCLGDVWDTAERQAFAGALFVHVQSEKMFLLANTRVTEEAFWDELSKPFLPFTAELWVWTVVVILGTSLVMALFEFHRNEGEFTQKGLISIIFKSLYLSATSFLSGGATYNAVTKSGRLMSLGYGLFILISIASYTASTANFLMTNSISSELKSLESVMRARENLCYPSGLREMLEMLHPAVKQLGISFDDLDADTIALLMTNGTCNYAVVGELWMHTAWQAGQHCDMKFVGSSILAFPTGFWVSYELAHAFSWSVALKRSEGLYPKAYNEFVRGSPSCSDKSRRLSAISSSGEDSDSDSDDSEPTARLGVEHMKGINFIVVACFVVAVVIRFFEHFVCPAPEDREVERAISGEVEHEIGELVSLIRGGNEEVKKMIEFHSIKGAKDEFSKTTKELKGLIDDYHASMSPQLFGRQMDDIFEESDSSRECSRDTDIVEIPVETASAQLLQAIEDVPETKKIAASRSAFESFV